MNLSLDIQILEARKEFYYWEFYQQSFHTGVVCDGYTVSTQVVKTDKAVIELLEKLRVLDEHKMVLEMKRKYWQRFLNNLRDDERYYIVGKYSMREVSPAINRLDVQVLEEIEKIETAVNFQTGRDDLVSGKYQLSDGDYFSNMDKILSRV